MRNAKPTPAKNRNPTPLDCCELLPVQGRKPTTRITIAATMITSRAIFIGVHPPSAFNSNTTKQRRALEVPGGAFRMSPGLRPAVSRGHYLRACLKQATAIKPHNPARTYNTIELTEAAICRE